MRLILFVVGATPVHPRGFLFSSGCCCLGHLFAVVLVLSMLTACAAPTPAPTPTPTVTPTPVPPTETPFPTATWTPTPTFTPTPTSTPTQTPTPTPRPTLSLTRATLTLADLPAGFAQQAGDSMASIFGVGTNAHEVNRTSFVKLLGPNRHEVVDSALVYPLDAFDQAKLDRNFTSREDSVRTGQSEGVLLPDADKLGDKSVGISMLVQGMRLEFVLVRRGDVAQVVVVSADAAETSVKAVVLAKLLDSRVAQAFSASTQPAAGAKPAATPAPGPSGTFTWSPGSATPGLQAVLKEIERKTVGGKTQVYYNLLTTGLAKGKTFTLWQKKLGESPNLAISGLYVNDAGKLVTQEGYVVEEAPMVAANMVRGESFDLALTSTDQAIQVYASSVPFPIEAKGPGNCRLSVRLSSAKGDLFLVTAEGFAPNEKIAVTTQSEQEVITLSLSADQAGALFVPVIPLVAGKTAGSASFAAVGQGCNLKVEYKWGTAALESQ